MKKKQVHILWSWQIVEVLLDSCAIELVMSSEFARKQGIKLKKIK